MNASAGPVPYEPGAHPLASEHRRDDAPSMGVFGRQMPADLIFWRRGGRTGEDVASVGLVDQHGEWDTSCDVKKREGQDR